MRQNKKTWSTRWNGHTIVVENWFDWRLRTGENVFVDGDLVCEHTGRQSHTPNAASILEAEIHDESGAHQLRVEVGTVNGLNINCRIFIDGDWIGGDTEKTLILPAAPATQLPAPAQLKQLKHELFFRAVVAPLILIPLCDMADMYFGNQDFSLLLFVVVMLFINVLQTVFKLWKISRDNPEKPTRV